MLIQSFSIVRKTYSLLCEEEKQSGLFEHKEVNQVHAMNVKSQPNFKQQNYDNQRQAKWTSSSKLQRSRKPLLCKYCYGTTHIVEMRYYLIGFSIGHKLHGKDFQPPN